MADYDLILKLLIVGPVQSGKSSLLVQYADSGFYEGYISTVGVDYRVKQIEVMQKRVKLQIWDTAGDDKFKMIT